MLVDIEHLLGFTDYTDIYGVEDIDDDREDNNYIIVPCRPTSPNIEVKLTKENVTVSMSFIKCIVLASILIIHLIVNSHYFSGHRITFSRYG